MVLVVLLRLIRVIGIPDLLEKAVRDKEPQISNLKLLVVNLLLLNLDVQLCQSKVKKLTLMFLYQNKGMVKVIFCCYIISF